MGSDTGKHGAKTIAGFVVTCHGSCKNPCSDLGRRKRRELGADYNADDMPATPTAPPDVHDMLGFRQGVAAVTTQQRLLEF